MGVAFSLVIRITDLIKVILGIIIISHFGIKLTQTMIKKNEENNKYQQDLELNNK